MVGDKLVGQHIHVQMSADMKLSKINGSAGGPANKFILVVGALGETQPQSAWSNAILPGRDCE